MPACMQALWDGLPSIDLLIICACDKSWVHLGEVLSMILCQGRRMGARMTAGMSK